MCARCPRIVSPTIHPTLKTSDNKVGPFRAERFKSNADRRFHLGYSCRSPSGSRPIATPGVQEKMWDPLSPWERACPEHSEGVAEGTRPGGGEFEQ